MKIEDGIYTNLSNEEYHASDAISKSMLDSINKGLAHYLWNLEAPKKEQDYLSLGTLVHCAVLEPTELYNRYAVMPKFDLRTKDGKAEKARFELENEDKICLDVDTFNKATMMRDSVMAHPVAKKLLSRGVAENSFFYTEENGLQLKVRPDWYNEEDKIIVDVKTTSDFDQFYKSIYNYRYHVQECFYTRVLNKIKGDGHKFYFIVVSTELKLGKYPVTVIELEDLWRTIGNKEVDKNLQQFLDIDTTEPLTETISVPSWIVAKEEQGNRDEIIIPGGAW